MELAVDGDLGDAECLCHLVVGEAAEVDEFDDLTFARVHGSEPLGRVVHFGQDGGCAGGNGGHLFQRYHRRTAAALLAALAPGIVDEDVAHLTSGEGEEMGAVLPRYVGIHEAKICFVHEGGGGKRMVGALGCHELTGERAQLAVDQGDQFVAGVLITVAPLAEQLSH